MFVELVHVKLQGSEYENLNERERKRKESKESRNVTPRLGMTNEPTECSSSKRRMIEPEDSLENTSFVSKESAEHERYPRIEKRTRANHMTRIHFSALSGSKDNEDS